MYLIKAAKGNVNTNHGDRIGRGFPHVGIDLGWGNGLELYAPAAGYLVWGWFGTYGNRAVITHLDGSWSLIAHAETFFVNQRHVRQGQHIGTMGRTGGPWGSSGWYVHCHQEYHLKSGVAVDPLRYMVKPKPASTDKKPVPVPKPAVEEEEDTMEKYVMKDTKSTFLRIAPDGGVRKMTGAEWRAIRAAYAAAKQKLPLGRVSAADYAALLKKA